MEIIVNNKFEINCKSIFTLSVMLCFSIIVMWTSLSYALAASEEMDPIDLLDPNLFSDAANVNEPVMPQNIEETQPQVFRTIPANLVTKIDSLPDLKIELQKLIGRIYSVEFKTHEPAPQPLTAVLPAEPEKSKDMQAESENNLIAPSVTQKDTGRQITNQTLQLLDELLQKPEQIKNPLELADILFHSGQLKQAGVCYRLALKRIPADNNDLRNNKAWILFQIGNCLKKDDPAIALQMYKQLIVEHPDSLWTDAAKVKCNLVEWYLREKPDSLLDK